MANVTKALIKFRALNEGRKVQLDLSAPLFNDFRKEVLELSFQDEGNYIGNGKFELGGRWKITNNLNQFEHIEIISYEFSKAIKKLNVQATHIVGDFCDMDCSMEYGVIGTFSINIQDYVNNFDQYSIEIDEDSYDFDTYLSTNLKSVKKKELDEYELEDIIWDHLTEQIEKGIKPKKLKVSTNYKEHSDIDFELIKELGDKVIFNLDFIYKLLNNEGSHSSVELCDFRDLLNQEVFIPGLGWDFAWFQMLKILLNSHINGVTNNKKLAENFIKLLEILSEQTNVKSVNSRGENIFFVLINPYVLGLRSERCKIVVKEDIPLIVEKLINLSYNPFAKCLSNVSFYDAMCLNPQYYISAILIVEKLKFENVNVQSKIFFRDRPWPDELNELYDLLEDEDIFIQKAKEFGYLDYCSYTGSNLLIAAIFEGKKRIVDFLLETPYDLEHSLVTTFDQSSSENDQTYVLPNNALMAAIYADDKAMIDLLIKKGANVNSIADDFSTPLLFAILKQDFDLVTKLTELGSTFKFNEIRHNLGLSDVFTLAISQITEIDTEFWEKVISSGFFKDYSDQFGNSLVFYLSNMEFESSKILTQYIKNKLENYPWLRYTELSDTDKTDIMGNLLITNVEKAKEFLNDHELNFNTKLTFSKQVTISFNGLESDNKTYSTPVLIYWFFETVKKYTKSEVSDYITLFKNFKDLGYDVNTTDTAIGNISIYSSIGNRNILLTCLAQVLKIPKVKRKSLYSVIEFLIDNGANLNSIDAEFFSVIDYLIFLREDNQAQNLFNRLIQDGYLSGTDQLRDAGYYKPTTQADDMYVDIQDFIVFKSLDNTNFDRRSNITKVSKSSAQLKVVGDETKKVKKQPGKKVTQVTKNQKPKSSVENDNKERLTIQLKIARNARHNQNDEVAKTSYERINNEDPSNWEATFFSKYYEVLQIEADDILGSTTDLSGRAIRALQLIKEHIIDAKELDLSISEVQAHSSIIGNFFHFTAIRDLNEIDEEHKLINRNQYARRIYGIMFFYYNIADSIDNLFGVNPSLGSKAVELWKAGIELNYEFLEYLGDGSKISQRQAIEQYKDKVKKYEPDFHFDLPKSTPTGGCYIATAVYSSYDCPEVWTLRRYRDIVLVESLYGRGLVRLYYIISPVLVRYFGNVRFIVKTWEIILNYFVKKLQSRGFKSTPYKDKEWF